MPTKDVEDHERRGNESFSGREEEEESRKGRRGGRGEEEEERRKRMTFSDEG